MSVKPADLLNEARGLVVAARSNEARRRTVVGRAYYAAYHALLKVALEHGYQYSQADDAPPGRHENLTWWAARYQGGMAEIPVAAKRVESLKRFRVAADYHLKGEFSFSDMELCVESATDIIEEILAA